MGYGSMRNREGVHRRRSLRLRGYDYSLPGPYYVTLCTQNKKCLFGRVINGEMVPNRTGRIIKEGWIRTGENRDGIELDEWVLMPNHLHGIVVISEILTRAIRELPLHGMVENEDSLRGLDIFAKAAYEFPQRIDIKHRRNMILPNFIGRFKMQTAKQVNKMWKIPGKPLWQKNYWERIIRDEEDLNRIRQYIRNNPALWEKDYLFDI